MGVLNVTPDSFADGGRFFDRERAVEHGLAMARDGADIIDVGGESTRPFSEPVPADREMERVLPVIRSLAGKIDVPISIDTTKAEVARAALEAGAEILNDVSALRFDPEMASVAAESGAPLVVMHMKGTPGDMQKDPRYEDLVGEILDFLEACLQGAVRAGVRREQILVDPGIGFGKTFDHNLQLIRDLGRFSVLGRPLVLGCSRKAFIGHLLGREADERDPGTMAAVAAGVMNGARVVRVHNVAMAVDTVRMVDAVKRGRVAP
jgi:dihydropteroate synthase